MSLLNPNTFSYTPTSSFPPTGGQRGVRSFSLGTLSDWLNTISGLAGGASQIISPDVQEQKESEAAIQAAKAKRNFNIFIGVSCLIIVGLLGWILIKK